MRLSKGVSVPESRIKRSPGVCPLVSTGRINQKHSPHWSDPLATRRTACAARFFVLKELGNARANRDKEQIIKWNIISIRH